MAGAVLSTFGSSGFAASPTTWIYTGATNGDVNVATNWAAAGSTFDVAPPNGANSDVALFDGTVNGLLTLTNGGSTTTASPGILLNITSTASLTIDSSAPLWRLGNGNTVSIASGAGAFSMGNNAGTTVTVQIGSTSATHIFTNNSSNAATIGSDILFGNGGTATHTINAAGSGNWLFNGAIDNTGTDKTQVNGTFNVSKTGSGITTLANSANNYSGSTTVSGGTLSVAANNALGFGGQYTLNRVAGITTVDGSTASATLDLGGSTTAATTVNEPIVLSGGTNGASLINSNTAFSEAVGNGIALIRLINAGSGYAASTGFTSLTTTIAGGGGTGATATSYKASSAGDNVSVIFMASAGTGYTSIPTVAITGANGNGSNAVAQAVLSSVTLNGTNNNIGGVGNMTISAVLGETVSGSGFTKVGSGTLTLNGLNTYSGSTSIAGGTLELGASGSLANTSTVGVADGATLRLTSVSAAAATSMINDNAAVVLTSTTATPDIYLDINGQTETVSSLVINGVTQPSGIYSATSAPLSFEADESYFSGSGSLTVVPEPASAMMMLAGAGALSKRRRRR